MAFDEMMQTARGCPLLGNSTCLLPLSPLTSHLGSRGCVHAGVCSSEVSCCLHPGSHHTPFCMCGPPWPQGNHFGSSKQEAVGADPSAWVPGVARACGHWPVVSGMS